MQSQNVIKPNKSSTPPQINIYTLPQLHPIQPPLLNKQAAQPLNLSYDQVKSLFQKSSPHQYNFNFSSKSILPPKIPLTQSQNELQSLRKQNLLLQNQLSQTKRLYQQQKFKYNELKNLYKEGQTMFEILQDKKITLEKQNKELKQLLENLYQQLYHQNQLSNEKKQFTGLVADMRNKQQIINRIPKPPSSVTNGSNAVNNTKIQRVKIGNKKIPVIKVNVPSQTFIKKQHSQSIFSQNSDLNPSEISKQQINALKQQIQDLKNLNNELSTQLKTLKQQLQTNKKLVQQYEQKYQRITLNTQTQTSSTMQRCIFARQQNIPTSSLFDFKSVKVQNHGFSESFNHGQMPQYHQNQQNLSFYKSKYNILETEVKKKDQTIKNLYNQCYSLQAEINKLKTQSFSVQPILPGSSRDARQTWTQQKHLSHLNGLKQEKMQSNTGQAMNQSFQRKGEWYYQRKINELQKRINELNQVCISNVNQSFKINELNDTISKLTRQNSQIEQKIINQEAQLSRLYKILENKNTQLSQIYTTITESKRNYAFDESKKKSINNIFINTPEKSQQFSSQNLFYSKGYSKDQSFH